MPTGGAAPTPGRDIPFDQICFLYRFSRFVYQAPAPIALTQWMGVSSMTGNSETQQQGKADAERRCGTTAELEDQAGIAIGLFARSGTSRTGCEISFRCAELLVLLLSRRGDRIARRSIIERLWGDVPWQVGRRRLNSTVHRLRSEVLQAAGPDRLRSSPDSLWLRFTEADWVDLIEFDRAFDRSTDPRPLNADESERLRSAADIYASELLPWLGGDWIENYRAQLENKAIAISSRLAIEALKSGNPQAAMRHSTAALEMDCLREDLHRVVIRAHLALEDRAAAIHHFELVKSLLAEHLDVDPMPETTRLIFGRPSEHQAVIPEVVAAAGRCATLDDPRADELEVEDLRRSLTQTRQQLARLLVDVDRALAQLARSAAATS